MSKCHARQFSDSMVCKPCNLTWDMNDPHPPKCNIKPTIDIEWEQISSDTFRSKTFGGWLVLHQEEASTIRQDSYGGFETEWGLEHRSTMTFVPDPKHEWSVTLYKT